MVHVNAMMGTQVQGAMCAFRICMASNAPRSAMTSRLVCPTGSATRKVFAFVILVLEATIVPHVRGALARTVRPSAVIMKPVPHMVAVSTTVPAGAMEDIWGLAVISAVSNWQGTQRTQNVLTLAAISRKFC